MPAKKAKNSNPVLWAFPNRAGDEMTLGVRVGGHEARHAVDLPADRATIVDALRSLAHELGNAR